MKNIYDALFDLVLNSSIPARDCDVSSLYRFAVGNRHPLHDYCNSVSFEKFAEDYRMIERDVQEVLADE